MLFNSIDFFIFLPITILLYSFVNNKYKRIVLLFASLYFYGSWNVNYIFLILFTAISSFYSGILIDKTSNKTKQKIILAFNLIVNFSILFIFKYFYFGVEILNDMKAGINLNNLPKIILPVGISFYTFQSLSYAIDVYRKNTPIERSIFRFILFVTYFPQLVAGPIERSSNLLPQMSNLKPIKYENVRSGAVLILWGLFKKIVIADRLAISANYIFNNPENSTTFSLIIGTIFFTYQIYCDFSGYSDIAIGVSQLFGIKLMENFRRPYFSKSITEFWRRWHISLSTWFRDYVYIPLGGNRVSTIRWIINTMIVFIVSGIWHGANYTFIIWGGIHGLMLVIEKIAYGKKINRKYAPAVEFLRWFATYIIVVIAWIFFRANSVGDATYILEKIFKPDDLILTNLKMLFVHGGAEMLTGLKFYDFVFAIVFIFLLELVHYITRKTNIVSKTLSISSQLRWSLAVITIFTILWFGKFGLNEFIYFQF